METSNSYSQEELQLIINIEKYKYYKQYVEPLEQEFDVLIEQVQELKEKLKHERMNVTRYKNKYNELKNSSQKNDVNETQRYRNMCVKLLNENKRLKGLLEKERNKNEM